MNHAYIILALVTGVIAGFIIASLLRANDLEDDYDEHPGPPTNFGQDTELIETLVNREFNISRAGKYVTVLESHSNEVVAIGTDLREVIARAGRIDREGVNG